MQAEIADLLRTKSEIRHIIVPEVEELLEGQKPALYAYEKRWDEAKTDPVIIFHTSGTTGKISTCEP